MVWGTERRRHLAALVAGFVLLSGLVGCGGGGDDDSLVGNGGSGGPARPGGITAAQAHRREQRVLNQRVRAVRERDMELFLRRVDHADVGLMSRQRRYYRNLVQLPLERFGYRVLDRPWEGVKASPRLGRGVKIPQVQLTMQLEGYDAVPVRRIVGFVFSFAHGKAMIVSDRTSTGAPLFAGAPAPWDLTAVTVRAEPRVLGIFDTGTRASADTITGAVGDGIDEIDRALPFSWGGHVVVYSVQSSRVLASFTDVPGGSVDHLGALTFPTYAQEGGSQVASTRMLVMPSSVHAGQPFLGRIIRHELSHVAIGIRDDGAPAWVSEGVAEYLGAREIPQRDRVIPTSALGRAQGEDNGMPVSKTFNNTDQEWHYALSWMACDYIADTYDESRLWELMDAMHNGGQGTTDAQQDRVLQQVLGLDGTELARRAAARIRKLYG